MPETCRTIFGIEGCCHLDKWHHGRTFMHQTFGASRYFTENGTKFRIEVTMRFDDNPQNGHNTFAITGAEYETGRRDAIAAGCIHDEIAKHFPELAHLIKWHLCSTDGPMHYVENTVFHANDKTAKKRNLEHARSSAVWPEATDAELSVEPEELRAKLMERLPALLAAFRADMEACGFHWSTDGIEVAS